jgi:type IV secretion system protein VirB9
MRATKYSFFISIVVLLLMAQPVYATETPVPASGDVRIKYYVYRPDTVYKYVGYYKIQSRIDLDPKEQIVSISMGNTGLWDIQPQGHRIFIKPKEFEAETNMTIITDKRIYYFELYAEEAQNMREGKVNFAIAFVYADTNQDPKKAGKDGSFFELKYPPEPKPEVPNPITYANYLNFNYSLAGSKYVSPLEVFDDGEFTYIKFKDINADLPAIFEVMPDGHETLINFRKKEGYIIIEKVSSRYTLRFGVQIACLFNDSMPMEIVPVKKEDKDKSFLGIF